jgi:peptidoglycan/LPS O-acetylase OafA/YrhL
MGLIRLLLAISVVLGHSNSIFGVSLVVSEYAVQLFYIISGFYMSLILNEKYLNKPYKLFITNRILRIYPIYFVVLLLTILISMSSGLLFANYGPFKFFINYLSHINIFYFIFLAFVNLSLIGQDLILFLGLDTITGNLFLTANFRNTDPQVHHFLLVPQAWTLALEIYFYLLAPFIVRKRTAYIIILMGISFGLRLWFYKMGFYHDPWTYRFFPFELFFFISGSLCYKVYTKIKLNPLPIFIQYIMLLYIVSFIIFYSFLPDNFFIKTVLLFISFLALLPFIFNFTKYNKIDRLIGELSYPVYIVHILIVGICRKFIPYSFLGVAVSLISIFVSYFLIRLVSAPIEKFRQSRVISYPILLRELPSPIAKDNLHD